MSGTITNGVKCGLIYNRLMIKSFNNKATEQLFNGKCPSQFKGFQAVAERKLQQLDSAATLEFLRSPPGNRLEALKRDRKGQHSIRVNGQYRVCFVWRDGHAHNVEIVDYH